MVMAIKVDHLPNFFNMNENCLECDLCICSDIIVSAPYDGENGRGVIYVFHGSESGIREQFTQRIQARDVSRDLKGFGFSLKGGRDVDGNGYPGISVFNCSFVCR